MGWVGLIDAQLHSIRPEKQEQNQLLHFHAAQHRTPVVASWHCDAQSPRKPKMETYQGIFSSYGSTT
jgi:hypothetical protein